MKSRFLSIFVLLLSIFSAPVHAAPVTVNFQGLTGDGQGLLGHAFVPRASIAHMNSFYAGIGVAGPYSRIVSPDAFNTTTGVELAHGANSPGTPFAATTLPEPHGREGLGLAGPLHISINGFTLNTSSTADLSFSGLIENRIYRNGSAAIFEEIAPRCL